LEEGLCFRGLCGYREPLITAKRIEMRFPLIEGGKRGGLIRKNRGRKGYSSLERQSLLLERVTLRMVRKKGDGYRVIEKEGTPIYRISGNTPPWEGEREVGTMGSC